MSLGFLSKELDQTIDTAHLSCHVCVVRTKDVEASRCCFGGGLCAWEVSLLNKFLHNFNSFRHQILFFSPTLHGEVHL